MKTKLVALLAAWLFATIAYAQEYPFWGLKMPEAADAPAIHLVKDADVLVANVTIVASKRNPAEQAADFANGLQALRAAVAKNPALKIKDERTLIGGGEPSIFASSYAAGKFNTRQSASDFKIFHPLNIDKDPLAAAEILRKLVGAIKLPSDVAVRIDSMQIEVIDTDSLRGPLLEAIASDITKIKSIFKESEIAVGGLQNKVQQRPLNNSQVVVFIPYTLTIGSSRRP